MSASFDRYANALTDTFTLERELGGGGMSRVFVATERRLGRKVVIKVLHPELAAGVSVERFEREMRVMAQLQNPRLVPVLSAGEIDGLPYFTMPFVEGESLRARMDRGSIDQSEAIGILRDVAQALDYAHQHQIVHRDIKPENILLSGATAMVTDFGIAKALSLAADTKSLTTAGLSLGTPAYMAPEQIVGDEVDARTDVYAWGVLAYELLGGAHPFAGKTTAQAIVSAHLTEVPPRLKVPDTVADVVERSLAKEPSKRPSSMAEVLVALDASRPSGIVRGARTPALRRWWWAVAAAAVIATSVWSIVRHRPEVAARPSPPGSLAVLNFSVEGGDTTIRYFAEGIADELSTALGRVQGVKVASRSAASHLMASAMPVRKIAEVLSVAAVLEGTVRRLGEQLRITLQLTNGTDGLAIWNGTYSWRTTDVFALQDTITRAVLAELVSTVGDSGALSTRRGYGTSDPEAYRLFLKARYFFDRRGAAGLRTAIDSFSAAVERDPQFARAYAGRAMARTVLPVFVADANTEQMLAQAEDDATRSLAIDSTLADAQLAMAQSLKMRWQWSEAERHFRAAIALAPNEALPHHWYGVMLYAVGRPDASVAELTRARSIDPYGATIGTDGALALYAARRYPEARAEIARSHALDSLKNDNFLVLASILLALGHPDSALRALDVARRLGSGMDTRGREAMAQGRLGRQEDARAIVEDLKRRLTSGTLVSLDLPIAALAAGDTTLTLRALERLFADRPMLVTEQSLPCEPLLDPVRAGRPFQEMLRLAGMTACR